MISRDQILKILTEAFPEFLPNEDTIDLPYVILGEFAKFLIRIYQLRDDDVLKKAAELIYRLHNEGDFYVKEAAIIGLLEGIQNELGHSGLDPEGFAAYLLPESRRWWDSLNRFWKMDFG